MVLTVILFQFNIFQFLIKLGFSVVIYKSHGQTINEVGKPGQENMLCLLKISS